MAAPSSKQSPSNQKMHESGSPDENRLKDPPPSSLPSRPAAGAAADAENSADNSALPTTSSTAAVLLSPTYRSSETSESYVLAKQLLNADNFEEALTIIEEELIRTKVGIKTSLGLGLGLDLSQLASDPNEDLETEIELHESLAPLHYLYGTILLYSVEEAKDDGNDTGAMMTDAGTMASTTATPSAAVAPGAAASPAEMDSPDPTNPWAHLSGPSSSAAAAPEANNNNNNNDDADATAEDIQIAWENLEAARTIVEKMLLQATTITTSSALSDTEVAKLQLDLAQIHLREGDLQRINGNYTSAVGDYSSCLEILLRHNHTKDEQNILRNLDRKIADTQFNLGLTYLTSSSDLQKEVASGTANANAKTTGLDDERSGGSSDAPGGAAADIDHRKKAALLAKEHCQKGILQHVDCARTFCGILAKICGVESETILSSTNSIDKETATGVDHKVAPSTPTTTAAADASQTLNVWRTAVAAMVLSHTPPDAEEVLRVSVIRQVLDEIQETIDEAERSQEGVLQAAQIKIKAQQAVAALGDDDNAAAAFANPDGSTTTIGFGQQAASSVAAAKSAAADAKPMMVVKKKKKRKDIAGGGGGNDNDNDNENVNINVNGEAGESKKEPEDGDTNKRAKTA